MPLVTGKKLNELLVGASYNENTTYLVSNGQMPIPYEDGLGSDKILKLVVDPSALADYGPSCFTRHTLMQCLPYFEINNMPMDVLNWLDSSNKETNVALELINLNPERGYPSDLLKLAGESLRKSQLDKCERAVQYDSFWRAVPKHLFGALLMKSKGYIAIPSEALRDFLLTGPPEMGDILTKHGIRLNQCHITDLIMKFPHVIEFFKPSASLLNTELVMAHPHLLFTAHKHHMNEAESLIFIEKHPEYAKRLMETTTFHPSVAVVDACIERGFHKNADIGPIFNRMHRYMPVRARNAFQRHIRNVPELLNLLGADAPVDSQVLAYKAGRAIITLDAGKIIECLLQEDAKKAEPVKTLEEQLKDAFAEGNTDAIYQLAKELVSK